MQTLKTELVVNRKTVTRCDVCSDTAVDSRDTRPCLVCEKDLCVDCIALRPSLGALCAQCCEVGTKNNFVERIEALDSGVQESYEKIDATYQINLKEAKEFRQRNFKEVGIAYDQEADQLLDRWKSLVK